MPNPHNDSHMAREIAEQPEALRRLLPRLLEREPQGPTPVDEALHTTLARATRLTFAACGSSRHAAVLGRYACLRLAALPCEVEAAHELAALGHNAWRGIDVAAVLSQSGETQDTLEALRLAHGAAVPTLALCNVVPSTLADEARWAWDLQAGPERAVPATKSFLAQACACLGLALHAGEARHTPLGPTAAATTAARAREAKGLRTLPEAVAETLRTLSPDGAQAGALARATQLLAGARAPVVLGRGPAVAIAHEVALKLREAAYLPAHAFAVGEFKHGPMAMLEPEHDVVVALLDDDGGPPGVENDTLAARTADNLKRLAQLGVPLVVVAARGHAHLEAVRRAGRCTVLHTPAAPPLVWPLLATVVLQRLTLDVAVARGVDVDAPRYLTKSIDVH